MGSPASRMTERICPCSMVSSFSFVLTKLYGQMTPRKSNSASGGTACSCLLIYAPIAFTEIVSRGWCRFNVLYVPPISIKRAHPYGCPFSQSDRVVCLLQTLDQVRLRDLSSVV